MLAVAAPVALACVMMLAAPAFLASSSWRLRFPRLALTLWYATFAGGVLALTASLLVSVLAAVLTRQTHDDVNWVEPTVLVVFGWVGLAACGALLALVFAQAEPLAHAERRLQAQFSLLAAMSSCRQVRGVDVVTVESDLPVALSVPGAEPRVILSTRLVAELSPVQLRAVIEHERAHLVQRHGLVSQIARLNRLCLPVLPAARELERTTSLLIELIADDAAARQVGAVNVANALAIVGRLNGDEAMLLRAHRLATRPPRGSLTTSGRVRRTLASLAG
ncbi:hypothetical protein C5C10_09205 [Rathayibacter sp. AY1A3]|nr:hypothetical protein C5C10_09205 [Rathayibacter sp. AY1A3]